MMRLNNTIALFSAALMLAACGTEESNNGTNNGGTNNGGSNNGASNNGGSNNGSNNGTANNGATNNGTANNGGNNGNNAMLPDEPYVTAFSFYEKYDSCLGSCEKGVGITVLTNRIGNLEGLEAAMDPADTEKFVTDHLGDVTMGRMIDGWDCRDVTIGGDMGSADMGAAPDVGNEEMSTFWFEARIQDGTNERYLQQITGCFLDADPEVMTIVQDINALGEKYLQQ